MGKGSPKTMGRVQDFKNNFHEDFKSGMSVAQIAKKYGIDVSYAYKLLEGIAEKNGVTREFYIIHGSNTNTDSDKKSKKSDKCEPENILDDISKCFDICINDISSLCEKITLIKKDNETHGKEGRYNG